MGALIAQNLAEIQQLSLVEAKIRIGEKTCGACEYSKINFLFSDFNFASYASYSLIYA